MTGRLALVACALALAACSRTGVVVTVHGRELSADQLRLTAIYDGRSQTRNVPEAPSPVPITFPTDLFAEFPPRAAAVRLRVEALAGGAVVASGVPPVVTLAPGQIARVDVELFGDPAQPPPKTDAPEMPARARYADVVLADKPLAYYRLDDTGDVARDSSGNNLHGLYGARVRRGAPGLLAGDADTAAQFSGGNGSLDGIVHVPRSTLLEPRAATVEFWMRQPVFNPDFAFVVNYGDLPEWRQPPPYAAFFYRRSLGFVLWTDSVNGDDPSLKTVTEPALDQTYHVVQVYDGFDLRIYVNGVLETQVPVWGDFILASSRAGLGIGGSPVGNGVLFAGTIDEVAIYGAALTPQQVVRHFVAGSAAP